MYYAFTSASVFKSLQPKSSDLGSELTWQTSLLYSDIVLPICVNEIIVLPVVMYGCESWTIKKAERWRIDAFELGVGEDSWESLGLQGSPTSPS